jgi:hypothetical protein
LHLLLDLLEGPGVFLTLAPLLSKQCVDYKEYGPGFNRFLPGGGQLSRGTGGRELAYLPPAS